MNIETLEVSPAADAADTVETFELLTLSMDDLDLIGGGTVIASLS